MDRLLFPANRPSAESILPEYQDLKVGDRIPDGPPKADCCFEVGLLEPHKYMVLHSRTQLFQQLREMPGTGMDWTWTFHLESVGERETRLLFRVRANLGPAWLRALYHLEIVPADFVMAPQHVPRPQAARGGSPFEH